MANSYDMRSIISPVQGSLQSPSPLSSVLAMLALPSNQCVKIMGIRVPSNLVDGELEAMKYLNLTACEGYCKDVTIRKLAILCALDSVTFHGKKW